MIEYEGYHPKIKAIIDQYKKDVGQQPQNWAHTAEIQISAKTLKITILSKWLIFRNFDLCQENGSHMIIFGPIHLIPFAFENWQPILGDEQGHLDCNPFFHQILRPR